MQLYSVSELARMLGVKTVVYGPPGTGKTPIIATAPRPIMLAAETGFMSLRKMPFATAKNTFPAYTGKDIDAFFAWFFNSREVDAFDTFCMDSASQICEIKLQELLPGFKDPRKAYGELERWATPIFTRLYFMQRKHIYLITKEEDKEESSNHVMLRPYFPGKALSKTVRHYYDLIMRVELTNDPNLPPRVFRTARDFDKEARDRSGSLALFEPTNLTHVFNKFMS
jgi:hypothetical protein